MARGVWIAKGFGSTPRWMPYADHDAGPDDFNCGLTTDYWYNEDTGRIVVSHSIERCAFSLRASNLFNLSRGEAPLDDLANRPSDVRGETARAATLIARTKLFDAVPFVFASGSFEGGYAMGTPAGMGALFTTESQRQAVMPRWVYLFDCKDSGLGRWPDPVDSYYDVDGGRVTRFVERYQVTCQKVDVGMVGRTGTCFDRVSGRIVSGRCFSWPHSRNIPVASDEEIRGWVEEQKSFIDGMKAMDSAMSEMYDRIQSIPDHKLSDFRDEMAVAAERLLGERFGPHFFRPKMW